MVQGKGVWGDLDRRKINSTIYNKNIRINDHFLIMLTLTPAGPRDKKIIIQHSSSMSWSSIKSHRTSNAQKISSK